MRFGSVCSGVESASVAWESLGWSAAWLAEIEPFPSAVLAHRFPHVMNVGDMTNIAYLISNRFIEAPDILVGGTPCQAFSVAGSRKSLDDDRGQLSLEYCKILDAIDGVRDEKCIAVWENVPGVLSTSDNAFGCFLGELVGAGEELKPTGKRWTNSGYIIGPKRQVAWRVLDAQFFGVPQRRRRVFVVASARDGFNPSEVLFEFDGLRRDSPPSRNAGQKTTGGIGASPNGTIENIVGTLCASDRKGVGNQMVGDGKLVIHGTQDPITQDDQAFPLGRNSGQENAVFTCATKQYSQNVNEELASPLLQSDYKEPQAVLTYGIQGNIIDRNSKQNGSGVSEECSHTLATQDRHAVAYGIQGSMIGRSDTAGPQGSGVSDDISFTLTTGDRHGVAYSVISDTTPKFGEDVCMTLRAQGGGGVVPPSVAPPLGLVRRLTPVECERLMGFPDNWTKVPYRGKDANVCPDGPRYAACGNSMVVHVMHWIGWRIDNYVTNK